MNKEMGEKATILYKEFEKIFTDKRRFTPKEQQKIINLGFRCEFGKHPKLYINDHLITLSCSASDQNTHRQTLRRIRKALIEEERKGNL